MLHEIFAGFLFCELAIFLSFAGTKFLPLELIEFSAGNYNLFGFLFEQRDINKERNIKFLIVVTFFR